MIENHVAGQIWRKDRGPDWQTFEILEVAEHDCLVRIETKIGDYAPIEIRTERLFHYSLTNFLYGSEIIRGEREFVNQEPTT